MVSLGGALASGAVVNIIIRGVDQFSSTFASAGAKMKGVGKLAMVGGAAVAGGLGLAIKTAMDFETAFTGVKKTVDLSAEGFDKLEQNFKDLSGEIPVSFQELSSIAEIAGQLGVEGVDDLTKFTKVIADISATTNLTSEQAATDLARISSVMGEPLDNIDRMGSAIVSLGNTFEVGEQEISAFAQRIAGTANIVGLSTQDILALGAAFPSVGVKAEMGGSAVQKTLLTMNKAVAEGGEDLQKFADIAGMSAEDFVSTWEADPQKIFEQFILGLGKQGKEGAQSLDGVGLGGIRTVQAMLSLAGAGDKVTRVFDASNTAWEENIALIQEAELRYGTAESQVEILKNNMGNMADEIGDVLIPILVDTLLPALQWLIDKFQGLSPGMQKFIVIGAAVGAAVLVIGGAILMLIPGLIALTGAIAGVTIAGFPLWIIILAIIAAVALIIGIFMRWTEIMEYVSNRFELFKINLKMLKVAALIVFKTIQFAFATMKNLLIGGLQTLGQAFIDWVNAMASAANHIPGVNIPIIPKLDLSMMLEDTEQMKAEIGSLVDEEKSLYDTFKDLNKKGLTEFKEIFTGNPKEEAAKEGGGIPIPSTVDPMGQHTTVNNNNTYISSMYPEETANEMDIRNQSKAVP